MISLMDVLFSLTLSSKSHLSYVSPTLSKYSSIVSPKSKHYGVKVMTNIRYLILLYVAGQVELFKSFGQKVDRIIYFSAVNLEKVANNNRFTERIIFERSHAMKDYYLCYDKAEVIHKKQDNPTKKDASKKIQTDLVALTKHGKKCCERIVENLLVTIPEQKRPKQKLTNVVATHQTSSPDQNFEKECQSYGLNWLRADYFELHKSTERDFDNWKKGFEFDLPSIKAKKELRRETLIADIKNKLENEGKLLIVGQSGSSKSTTLLQMFYGLSDICSLQRICLLCYD
jgi:ABC-type multidrug transport system fused ATPase/permease subunit